MEWLALAGLGVFHGLNPAMGWLFAVALGLQERSRAALLRAVVPIAVGHELSVAAIAVTITVTASAVAQRVIVVGGALVLVGFGLFLLLRRRHFRWVGMRLTPLELGWWSFLMSSVHGAGLMLLPVLTAAHPGHAGHGLPTLATVGDSVLLGLSAAAVHGAAMAVTLAAVALLVFEVLGLEVLRRAWVNLDRVWAFALLGTGAASLLLLA